MYITGITLDGLDLMGTDYYFTLHGMFDFEKTIVTNDLYYDGQAYGRSKNNPKTLVLNGNITTGDVTKIMALNQVLTSNGLKELRVNVKGLVGTSRLDEDLWLIGYVEVVNRIEGETTRSISVQLIMSDPYWVQEPSMIHGYIILSPFSLAALTYPIIYPITYGDIIGESVTVNVGGNADAYPIFTITGTCDTPVIYNDTTGESISLDVSLGADDEVVVDCNPATRSVVLNGTNRIDLKTSAGWLHLQPGDNILRFIRNSSEIGIHCTFTYQKRWI